MQHEPKIGEKYRHYKRGGEYEIIGFARHTETDEELIIYKGLYSDSEFPFGFLWARPKAMFMDILEFEGKKVSRFQLVEEV